MRSTSAVPTIPTTILLSPQLSNGKMILCEKPLAMNVVEAEAMVKAVEKAGVPNIVWYNYRRVPAVTLAKQLIDEGRLGTRFPLSRRFSAGLDHLSRSPSGWRGALAA